MTQLVKSPWEILSLLYSLDSCHHNLTVHERAVLAVIVNHVNGKTIAQNGYKAWPSTDTIVSQSGVQKSTTERSINKLVNDGWVSKESGKGKGSSNTYYVNADKIVQAAALSGAKITERKTGKTVVVDVVKEQHIRNTSGLVQNRGKEKFCQWIDGVMYDNEQDYQQALEDNAPF